MPGPVAANSKSTHNAEYALPVDDEFATAEWHRTTIRGARKDGRNTTHAGRQLLDRTARLATAGRR